MTEIITNLDELRVPSEPLKFAVETGIQRDEGDEIITKLLDVLNSDSNMVAATAPQIGINKRIFAINFNGDIKVFINPIITKKMGRVFSVETFSSMPGKEIFTTRPKEIQAVYHNGDFKYEDNKFLGEAAKLFDQLCETLDGIMPDELGMVYDVDQYGSFFDLTDGEKKEFVEIMGVKYSDYSALKKKELEESFDDEDKEIYRKLKATEGIINGRIAIVEPEKKLNREQRRAIAKVSKNNKENK